MRRVTAISSLLALVISVSAPASDLTKGLPPFRYPKGRTARAEYVTARKKAEADYKQAVAAARKKLIASLDEALKEAMHEENLEEANKIDAIIKSLTRKGLGPQAGSAVSYNLVGVWRYPNGTTIAFKPNGTWHASWGKGKTGAWRHLGGRKFQFGGRVIELAPDLKSFKNPKPEAGNQTIVKITGRKVAPQPKPTE